MSSLTPVAVAIGPVQVLVKVASAKAHYRRAEALLGQGRIEEADTAVREALRLEPGDRSVRVLQGRIRRLERAASVCVHSTPDDQPPAIGPHDNPAEKPSKEVFPELTECSEMTS